jgi:hypothetical protein
MLKEADSTSQSTGTIYFMQPADSPIHNFFGGIVNISNPSFSHTRIGLKNVGDPICHACPLGASIHTNVNKAWLERKPNSEHRCYKVKFAWTSSRL